MKTNKLILYIILILLVGKDVHAQLSNFNYRIIDSSTIEYDYSKFTIDINSLRLPDTDYINKVAHIQDDLVYTRGDTTARYVFPALVKYKDSVMLITFTASGLYALNPNETMFNYEQKLRQALLLNDTIYLDSLSIGWVGSSNYVGLEPLDPEVILFKDNKWLFLNFFFQESETGDYTFIGDDRQIPAVVLYLYSWGILVSDGHGSDQIGTIYIAANDYPKFVEADKPDDLSWVTDWMSVFGEYHIFGKRIHKRGAYYIWDKEWWKGVHGEK